MASLVATFITAFKVSYFWWQSVFLGYVVYGRRRLKTDLIDKQGYEKLNGCIW